MRKEVTMKITRKKLKILIENLLDEEIQYTDDVYSKKFTDASNFYGIELDKIEGIAATIVDLGTDLADTLRLLGKLAARAKNKTVPATNETIKSYNEKLKKFEGEFSKGVKDQNAKKKHESLKASISQAIKAMTGDKSEQYLKDKNDSRYEYLIKGEEIFMTASPSGKYSREKPLKIDPTKHKNSYRAVMKMFKEKN